MSYINSLIGKHLVDAADLIAGGNDERDHGRAISSGGLQILDELLHLEDLNLWPVQRQDTRRGSCA